MSNANKEYSDQCHSVKALWPETILDDCLVKSF